MATPPLAPGPRTRLPGGDLLAFRRDPLGTLERAARDFGDVAGLRFGPRRVTLLSGPERVREVLVTRHRGFIKSYALQRARVLLGEGLLTSEAPLHLRQRRLAQPAFHRERIAGYAATMVEYADRMAGGWHDGAETDVSREMARLTLAVAGKTLFGAEGGGRRTRSTRRSPTRWGCTGGSPTRWGRSWTGSPPRGRCGCGGRGRGWTPPSTGSSGSGGAGRTGATSSPCSSWRRMRRGTGAG